MEIRFATARDLEDVRYIWKICFSDSETYMNLFFSTMYVPGNTLLAVEENKVIGALQFFYREICFENKTISSAYIGGVSVLPDFQGKGIASKLMLQCETVLSAQGVSLLFLVPAVFPIYRRLGYTPLSCLTDISGKSEDLKPFITENGSLFSAPFPFSVYEHFQKSCSLSLKREETQVKKAIELSENALIKVTENADGYLIYKEENGLLLGLECIYETESAFREILGFIYAKRNDVSDFRLRMPTSCNARWILFDKAFTETRYPHILAKAIDGHVPSFSDKHYINMIGWF